MTPEMLMADGVRFGLLRDWLSDLPDDYCLAIWRERVRHETGDPEGDPYCVRLVSGDPLNQHEREALGSAPTLNEALSKACDSTMSDEALREIADYERGSRPALAGSPDAAFQKLWTKYAALPGYEKAEWTAVFHSIWGVES